MPIRRILNVPALLKIVWNQWPNHGTNQFMSQGHDRLRTELQNRLPEHGNGPSSHVHLNADTCHIIIDGEGVYQIAPGIAVDTRPGDIFLTRGGQVHGGRGTNAEKPLRYLVLEGPAPETISGDDGERFIRNWGREDGAENDPHGVVGYNGGIAGTYVLLGGPTERPTWVDELADEAYRDR